MVGKEKLETFNIAIVGFGPKGCYAFERLLAQLKARRIQYPIVIHLFNQNECFAAGNIYRPDQPSYLLMNYANSNINCWTDEEPQAILENTPDFVSWLRGKPEYTSEAKPEVFAPRGMVGTYLMESFARLFSLLPHNIELVKHVHTVSGIERAGKKYRLFTDGNKSNTYPEFDNIMLTTGHLGCGADFLEENHSNCYIDFVYPTQLALEHIESGAKVAIKGFGLTCIDALLALTEGRGGAFSVNKKGEMAYKQSGKEPGKIYIYSRTGLPMMPRTGLTENKQPLVFFTKDRIADLKATKPVSFEKSIFPLIIKECTVSYYKVLFRNYRWRLLILPEFEGIQDQIKVFHNYNPDAEKFNWEKLLDPLASQAHLTHGHVTDYMNRLLVEAERGIDESPLSAVFATWRRISAVFNEVYSFGGMDAASHQLFDCKFFGLFNRIAYGPPVKNMKKILALAKAGLVDFGFVKGAIFKVDGSEENYGILKVGGRKEQAIDYLINARIPRNNENETPSPLYRAILQKGIGRKYLNTNEGTYTPGCLDMDSKGRLIAADGKVNEGIVLYGTPTEGLTLDNDTLSRKRNNFASQWAEDIAQFVAHKEKEKNCIENES